MDVTAQIWLRPAPGKLQILLRVPLQAVRDVQFPEQPGGFLDIEKLTPLLPAAAKVTLLDSLDLYEGDAKLAPAQVRATQISLAADRSFETFAQALAHTQQTKPANAERLLWNQVHFDVLAETPIRDQRSPFAIRARLDHLASRVGTALRFELPGGISRAYQWSTDPGIVPLDPSWTQAARGFIALGVEHILSGADHLLFLLCLIIPVRRIRELIWVITAFTLAHSLTLIAAAYQWAPQALWFPPLIETLIAASIFYMAIENVWSPAHTDRRWMLAFAFGLIHGCGFSFALHESMQFAGSHLLLSLLSFNIGVELGQLAVLIVAVPLLGWLLRRAERTGVIILSTLVAHTAWHWMAERWDRLSKFSLAWPAWDAASLAALLRALALLLLLAGALWLVRRKQRALS